MLFMVIERFASGNPLPIYARFRDQGRLASEGLKYVSSWVSKDLTHCYQVMETDDRGLLVEWMAKWNDLADFEVEEVVTSMEARANVLGE
jgi:hypothetical protein